MLTAGHRIGAFEVLALIGAGGMGEVYRARDHKLNRDVALKIVTARLTEDDGLRRFVREAPSLAALNHPHIAQIYGLEDTGETRALVMELVEGEDLAERVARGRHRRAFGGHLARSRLVGAAFVGAAEDRAAAATLPRQGSAHAAARHRRSARRRPCVGCSFRTG